jgi:deoxyribodipyrimidine photolyase-related protein
MSTPASTARVRQLLIVLGDQLDPKSVLFEEADPAQDCLWMAEVAEESTHVWSHKARIVLFLSAMRHFAEARREEGWRVSYRMLDDPEAAETLADALRRSIRCLQPERVVFMRPGDWRVRQELLAMLEAEGIPYEEREDDHFYCSVDRFKRHAKGRKQWRMEFFYREMRREHGVLMAGKDPEGGAWNYDASNRQSFGRAGPDLPPASPRFRPDAITRSVIALVEKRFHDHPGDLDTFNWPVTPEEAEVALDDFIQHRLADFGRYQDAMWTGQPFLNHSLISAALNLKLLNPRQAVVAAEKAWHDRQAPLEAVEGFIRQILGWREYIRGIYWLDMPAMLERNALDADAPLPPFYWTADTPMACLREVVGQTLRYGYAHHIQRLMVTGLYALLLGVEPKAIHAWYLAVYVDAVEWVEAPNVLGMSQYADGGMLASKPYVATGKYIQRMSNYCGGCPYNPAESTGEQACPFTTLYWDFLLRHAEALKGNPRTTMQLRNLDRLSDEKREAIQSQAETLRRTPGVGC